MTIKWEAPPSSANRSGGRSRDWGAILAELDKRPGEWAVVAEDVSTSAKTALQNTRPGYEFTNRGVALGRAAKLYARRVKVTT